MLMIFKLNVTRANVQQVVHYNPGSVYELWFISLFYRCLLKLNVINVESFLHNCIIFIEIK